MNSENGLINENEISCKVVSTDDYDLVAPAAGPMIESMRAHGYSTATAIADIIDNSISANAKNIWISFQWEGGNSHVSILDDGFGMSEKKLRDSMRLGSKSPLDERDSNDLGRFGLGLKTASFSQCRRLTLASKENGRAVAVRRWDLDHVVCTKDWQLLKHPYKGSERFFKVLDGMNQGTVVLWELMDRIVEKETQTQNEYVHERFLQQIEDVRNYLSMVFHRYLEGLHPNIKIYINGKGNFNKVIAWDPFMEMHQATIPKPSETIFHPKGNVLIQGFVLPHKDKLTKEDYDKAAGYGGWNSQQGFYIYRNKRMLVSGGWLGLGTNKPWTQEEQYKLARILVEIPNSQDIDWQIDVKKSTAKPPQWLRERLIGLASAIRKAAREVFAYRGSYTTRAENIPITRAWLTKTLNGRLSYRIEREHPLVASVNKMLLTSDQKKVFEAMLRTLEETMPIARIWLDTAEQSEAHSYPFETADELEKRRLVEITLRVLREKNGLTTEAAIEKLRSMEGFSLMSEIINEIR